MDGGALGAAFGAHFGAPPEALVHAPGRVNLVGDHVDYLGLPVLPLALQLGVTVALRARADARVRLANADARFPSAEFAVGPHLEPVGGGAWEDYVRAAVLSVVRRLGVTPGFDALVGSTLPAAAGLSSSSALVVAAALAALQAARATLPPLELAELLARGERFVGTEGGGMDQAVSLAAVAGHALHISFEPLRVRPVRFPAGWRLLVAPTLRESRKSAEVRAAYNERARGARRALAAAAGDVRGDALLALLRADPERFEAAARHQPRLRHVLSETTRVGQAVTLLERADAAAFGSLMTESHASLRDDYEVSTPELDRIVDIALGAGALGARLTGAGFGGCAIALCTEQSLPGVMAALQEHYYEGEGAPPGTALFVAEPCAGAVVSALADGTGPASFPEADPREDPHQRGARSEREREA